MRYFDDAYYGRRVLITGHSGFKGSWLATWLIELGAQVCGVSLGTVSDPSAFEAAQLEKAIDSHFFDIRDFARLRSQLLNFRPDFVFHLAAQGLVSRSYADPLGTITTNIVGTANLLQCLREADWPLTAVIITSDKCYENVEWPWGYRETDHLGGKDIYSGSKGAAELVFHAFQQSFFKDAAGLVRLATARAGNVIGGGDWAADRIVADCVRAWSQGRTVEIRSPESTRPWQHVLEPLSGYLRLGQMLRARAELSGESFNFGPRSEQNRKVVELISALADSWGFADGESAYVVANQVPFHEAGLLKLNCDKALQELLWEPTLVFEECIGMTGGWYRSFYRDRTEARALMVGHVKSYMDLAAERRRAWCR